METEIVVKRTMADAVTAYRVQQAEYEKAETERKAEIESELMDWFEKGGMTPLRIDGNLVTFEYEGDEVQFRVFKADYGRRICRVRGCKCGEEVRTYDGPAAAAYFGQLLVEPKWEYHICRLDTPKETAEQRLISALRDLLGPDDE